jgi:hypothetical protein
MFIWLPHPPNARDHQAAKSKTEGRTLAVAAQVNRVVRLSLSFVNLNGEQTL